MRAGRALDLGGVDADRDGDSRIAMKRLARLTVQEWPSTSFGGAQDGPREGEAFGFVGGYRAKFPLTSGPTLLRKLLLG